MVLVGGRLVLYVAAGLRQVLTFALPEERPGDLLIALRMLHEIPRVGRRRFLVVEKVDGLPVRDWPRCGLLEEAGFVSDYRGMTPDPAGGHRA